MRFGQLPLRARLYIVAVALAAGAFAAAASTVELAPRIGEPILLIILCAAAALAHSFPVSAPGKQAFHVSLPFFVVAALLLPPGEVALLIAVVHLVEWLRHRRSWFAQLFNTAAYLLSAAAAQVAVQALGGVGPSWSSPVVEPPLGAALAAVAVFLAVNRALVSAIVWLANGVPPRRQRMFDRETLLIDSLLAALGLPIAFMITSDPGLALIAAAPLLLVHRALDLPNIRAQRRQDAMTQLYTGSALVDICARELGRARRFNRSFALLLIDVDGLGQVNADFGHQAGDAVIQGLARLLDRETRDYDVAARVAGGQFAVLLPETSVPAALATAERLRKAAAQERYEVASSLEPLRVTVSIGAVLVEKPSGTAERLFAFAEAALEEAKRGGRDRVASRVDDAVISLAPTPGEAPPPSAARAVPVSPPAAVPTPASAAADAPAPAGDAPAPAADAAPPSDGGAVPATGGRRWPVAPEMASRLIALVVAGAATLLIVAVSPRLLQLDPTPILILSALVVLAELQRIDMFGRTSFSISVVPALAAGMLMGLPGAVVVAPLTALMRGVQRRSRWYKIAFNAGTYVLAAAASAEVFAAFQLPLEPSTAAWLLPPALLAGAVFYLHTFLVALAMSAEAGDSPVRAWNQNFRWLWPQYLTLGAMGLLLALAYDAFGVAGVAAFVVPPLMMRYVAKQYVDHTLEHVRQLRDLNEQLAQEVAQRRAAEEENSRLAEEAARAAALDELSRLKSEFISIASHELRTPLTAVLGFSELVLADTPADDPRHRPIAKIHQGAHQLSGLVENLLDISRIETGRMTVHPSDVELTRVVATVFDTLAPQSPLHTLVADLDDAAAWIYADPDKLSQILTNLVGNAVKYSPDGGEVRLTCRVDGPGMVRISVSDQGIGIPPDYLHRVFDRFQRVDSSATRRIRGTGLGLYIVRHLVDLHGGTVWVESEIGQGSTFHVRLPAARRGSVNRPMSGRQDGDADAREHGTTTDAVQVTAA